MIKIQTTVIMILSIILIGVYHVNSSLSTDVLKVSFLDIGQGDSILIEAPNGVQLLVDAGPDGEVVRQLGKVMKFYDHSIDLMLETHEDSDHISGFVDVLDRYEVGEKLVYGTSTKDTETVEVLENSLLENDVPIRQVAQGDKIILDSKNNIYVEVISPFKGQKGSPNDLSVVLKVVYAETELLLTGDISETIERGLIASYGNQLESDVLKIGHHGSRTSTSDEFLKVVNPKYAVIQVGKENKYGHPDPDVLERIKGKNIEILRNDEEGTVVLTSDGKEFSRLK